MADVVQATVSARVKLERNNGVVLYNQSFNPAAETYTQHVGQTIQIGSGASATLSIGNISVVRNVLLQADGACTIKVNAQASGAALAGASVVYAAYACSLTAIKVVNSAGTTLTVQYIVTD